MLYFIVGILAISIIGGLIIGAIGSASEGENPIKGASLGAGFGLLFGLQQGCGCLLAGLALMAVMAVGKWILG
jgi:hypothetical protein